MPQCTVLAVNTSALNVESLHGNSTLTTHRQIHSGEKAYEDTVCSKQFTQPAEFTVERSRINVESVTRHLVSLEI